MTRAVGRHEHEIANGPPPSFHSRGRSNASISLLGSSINFAQCDQPIPLSPRRSVSQIAKIES
jgi:hypothetical protein